MARSLRWPGGWGAWACLALSAGGLAAAGGPPAPAPAPAAAPLPATDDEPELVGEAKEKYAKELKWTWSFRTD